MHRKRGVNRFVRRTAQIARFLTRSRSRSVRLEDFPMLRPLAALSELDLERELLRKGVTARHAVSAHCADCGRQPLIGETVHVYDLSTVCALCRPRRRSAPHQTHVVRHQEHGLSVRRIAA